MYNCFMAVFYILQNIFLLCEYLKHWKWSEDVIWTVFFSLIYFYCYCYQNDNYTEHSDNGKWKSINDYRSKYWHVYHKMVFVCRRSWSLYTCPRRAEPTRGATSQRTLLALSASLSGCRFLLRFSLLQDGPWQQGTNRFWFMDPLVLLIIQVSSLWNVRKSWKRPSVVLRVDSYVYLVWVKSRRDSTDTRGGRSTQILYFTTQYCMYKYSITSKSPALKPSYSKSIHSLITAIL